MVLMAGACGDIFLAAALALAGTSSVLGRLLDFWVCGDAHEAARLVGRGTLWAEEALAAVSGAECESFGAEDDFGGGAVLDEVADCFAMVLSLSSSADNLSERFAMFSGSICDAQNEIHWSPGNTGIDTACLFAPLPLI